MTTEHHPDPLTLAIKKYPLGYFCVMFLLGLAVGTIFFDLLEYLDVSVVPTIKAPRYIAAIAFAFATHIGLSWRRKSRANTPR
jgi:hypothetical protein